MLAVTDDVGVLERLLLGEIYSSGASQHMCENDEVQPASSTPGLSLPIAFQISPQRAVPPLGWFMCHSAWPSALRR